MKEYPYIEVRQPIGTFYLCCIPASILVRIVTSKSRNDYPDGVQRERVKDRIKSIINFCSDPDAVFPTPIVVSVDKQANVSINADKRTITIPENSLIGDVIDGQHRLWGIKESGLSDNFDLPVVFMFDLLLEEKAYVFATINSNQKKVDPSLIYDLFDVSSKRSPGKTVHEIARAMNYKEDSPFYNRLKMLGKREPSQPNATLSQGTFAKSLLMLISKKPDDDARILRNGGIPPQDQRLPLRQLFIDDRDDLIAKIMFNCFNALKRVFPDEWENPNTNILWKTTGFRGVLYAFPTLMSKGMRDRMLTETYFVRCFQAFKQYLEKNDIRITSESFSGGGEQNQKRFATYLATSIRSLDPEDFASHQTIIHDVDNYITCIDANIYEIYDLSQAIEDGTTDYDTMTVTSYENEISISHPCTDSKLVIPVAMRDQVLEHLKSKYMNGMDATSWLGYEEALRKDD